MIERIFIEQGIKKIELENYLKKQLNKAGFVGLDIVKTPLVTRIVLLVARPGLAIGKGGENIRQLTEEIGGKFGIDNPQIEIREIEQPELNVIAIVDRITGLLTRGYSWRSIAFRTVRDTIEAGAQGVELILSGKLAGKGGRKRKQRIAEGYMKKVGNQTRLVDYAKATAYPRAGAIGVKLRIIKPNVVFPDKVNVKEFVKEKKEKEGEKAEKKEKKKKKKAEEKEGKKVRKTKKRKEGKKKGKNEAKKTGKKKVRKKSDLNEVKGN